MSDRKLLKLLQICSLSLICGQCSFQSLQAQTCPSSCPSEPSCGGESSCLGTPAGGNKDSTCSYSSPDPCKYYNNPYYCPYSDGYSAGCCYVVHSPIVLDLEGSGFHFTDVKDGVMFRLAPGDRYKSRVSWPALGSSDAWLVLDRNGNGLIDDLSEMFGNITAQPEPPRGQQRNGFLALAVFDKPENGGNGDGQITDADAVFEKLQLWQDSNHNGISEPSELHKLASFGVAAISLKYSASEMEDQYGNKFKYRGTVTDDKGGDVSKTAWDVYLVARPETVSRR